MYNSTLSNVHLEPETSVYKWLFQLDDSKSLYRKWLEITKHPFKTRLFGVPCNKKSKSPLLHSPPTSGPSNFSKFCQGDFRQVRYFVGGDGFKWACLV